MSATSSCARRFSRRSLSATSYSARALRRPAAPRELRALDGAAICGDARVTLDGDLRPGLRSAEPIHVGHAVRGQRHARLRRTVERFEAEPQHLKRVDLLRQLVVRDESAVEPLRGAREMLRGGDGHAAKGARWPGQNALRS